MIKKLLPIILLLIGTGAGVGAGVFLRPPPPEPTEVAQEGDGEHGSEDSKPKKAKAESDEEDPSAPEYAKLSNQFVIPIVKDAAVSSLVVMSLSIEVEPGNVDAVFQIEPKLRDSFLQVMFDHANVGGFRGVFTNHENLGVLRSALREVAVRDGGDYVRDVLILEIARQDY